MRWKGNCFILLKATYVKSENDSPVGIKKKKKKNGNSLQNGKEWGIGQPPHKKKRYSNKIQDCSWMKL